jgi:hypothetical protein
MAQFLLTILSDLKPVDVTIVINENSLDEFLITNGKGRILVVVGMEIISF